MQLRSGEEARGLGRRMGDRRGALHLGQLLLSDFSSLGASDRLGRAHLQF